MADPDRDAWDEIEQSNADQHQEIDPDLPAPKYSLDQFNRDQDAEIDPEGDRPDFPGGTPQTGG